MKKYWYIAGSLINAAVMLGLANKLANKFGFRIKLERLNFPYDISGDEEFMKLYAICKPFSMTTIERMYSLYQALNYIIDNKIEGDLVECGVWKGGSSMLMTHVLLQKNEAHRKIYLYDTFEGMSEPSEMDKTVKGIPADQLLKKQKKNDDETSVWCYSPIEDVKTNLYSTGYPESNLVFVQGKIEETLSSNMPGPLALLRLDTDWYESTKVELELLFPLLKEKAVLIVDDFGHWEGAKKAVIEYFQKIKRNPLFNRIDYTGRLIIK